MNLVSVLRSASIRFPEAAQPASEYFPDDVSYYDPAEVADQISWEWEDYWYLAKSKRNFLDHEVDLAWKEHDAAINEVAFEEYSLYLLDTILSIMRSSWPEGLVESASLKNDTWLVNEQRKQARAQRRISTKRRQARRKNLVNAVLNTDMSDYESDDAPWKSYVICVHSHVRTHYEAYIHEGIKRVKRNKRSQRWVHKMAAHDLHDTKIS